MTDETRLEVDVNRASIGELSQVPGIGVLLAERIVAQRPYHSLDDLVMVRGITPWKLEHIRPYLILSAAETPSIETGRVAVFDQPQTAAEEPDAETAAEPLVEPPPPAEEPRTGRTQPVAVAAARGLSLSDVILVSAITSLLSFLLAVFLTLGVLLLVNRTLSYAPVQQVNGLELQLEQLQEQAGTLQSEVSGLRTRLDNLEALSGRMNTLENENRTLQDAIDGFRDRVNEIGSQADRITTTLESLSQENSTFQRFIDGLRNLLNQSPPNNEETP